MKQKYIDYYMDVAERTSKLSYARRLQVGAVIVKDNRILSYGYNGMPAGWDNNCEEEVWNVHDGDFVLKTRPEVLHAESNAIAKVSGSTESSDGATIFCTHAPCIHCAKMIYQSGIKSVYYRDHYRDDSGLEFLHKGGIDVHKYPNSV